MHFCLGNHHCPTIPIYIFTLQSFDYGDIDELKISMVKYTFRFANDLKQASELD